MLPKTPYKQQDSNTFYETAETTSLKLPGCYPTVIIGVIGVVIWIAITSGSSGSMSSASRTADRSDACFMSQKFVKRNLKAPTTAQFPSRTKENCNATQTGSTWKVRSYVDAQNSFGAMIRSDYGVEMTYNPSTDTWTLVDIMIWGR